jgi:hypothetical protein
MTDPFAQQAEVSDLSRRIAQLEAIFIGRAHQIPHPTHLVGLYWAACRNDNWENEGLVGHWERQLFVLDARALLIMARQVRDPTPWYPLLILLDRYIAAGFDLDVCRQHLLSIAQDLLNLQGLRKISPRDVMGNPLRIKTALAAISRRGGLHAQKARP